MRCAHGDTYHHSGDPKGSLGKGNEATTWPPAAEGRPQALQEGHRPGPGWKRSSTGRLLPAPFPQPPRRSLARPTLRQRGESALAAPRTSPAHSVRQEAGGRRRGWGRRRGRMCQPAFNIPPAGAEGPAGPIGKSAPISVCVGPSSGAAGARPQGEDDVTPGIVRHQSKHLKLLYITK